MEIIPPSADSHQPCRAPANRRTLANIRSAGGSRHRDEYVMSLFPDPAVNTRERKWIALRHTPSAAFDPTPVPGAMTESDRTMWGVTILVRIAVGGPNLTMRGPLES